MLINVDIDDDGDDYNGGDDEDDDHDRSGDDCYYYLLLFFSLLSRATVAQLKTWLQPFISRVLYPFIVSHIPH